MVFVLRLFCVASRRRHTRGAVVTGVQRFALPILFRKAIGLARRPHGKGRFAADTTSSRLRAKQSAPACRTCATSRSEADLRSAPVPLCRKHGPPRALASQGLLAAFAGRGGGTARRSEEPTSELQSLMRTSYAVFTS